MSVTSVNCPLEYSPSVISQLEPGVFTTGDVGHLDDDGGDRATGGAGLIDIELGGRHRCQDLRLIEMQADGSVKSRSVIPVAFVPLTGGDQER